MDTVNVGTPATLMYPQDRYGYVAVRVTPTGKTAWFVRIESKDKDLKVSHMVNGFPVYDHVFTSEEIEFALKTAVTANYERASLRKDGTWKMMNSDTPLRIGEARYRRDYSD